MDNLKSATIYTETCVLPYVKQMTSASSMHEARHSKPALWDNPEEQDGEGGGTHVHTWLIHVAVWQKPPQYWKVITFQLN